MFTRPPHIAPAVVGGLVSLLLIIIALLYWYALSDRSYSPQQPVPFSHESHTAPHRAAMDCRSCHVAAEQSARAGLPPTSTCLDCHRHILADDPRLLPLHSTANPDHPAYTAETLRWVRSCALPDSVNFHHGLHSAAAISCEECHPTPDSNSPHSMRNCLDCHRRRKVPTNCDRCHQ